MNKLLTEPLFYILFIYGISFLSMGVIISNGISRGTSLSLVSPFYLLVFFGIAHGAAELFDWLRLVFRTLAWSEDSLFVYISQISMILSFGLLTQFGVNLLTFKSKGRDGIRLIPFALLALYLVVVLSIGVRDILTVGLFARYIFGFTGSMLCALVFFKLGNSMKALGNTKLIWGLHVSGAAFLCYAFFGGMIVAPIFGLPVQLFRAACALTIAVSSSIILDIFNVA